MKKFKEIFTSLRNFIKRIFTPVVKFLQKVFAPLIKLTNKMKSVEITYKNQKRIWAAIFLAPWVIGFVLLFLVPLVRSLVFSFYELTPQAGYIEQTFIGFQNYAYAINEHVTSSSSFRVELLNTTGDSLINLPVLLIFSLFIAVLLNMKFRGRAAIRAIFFIPVILNSAAVATALGGGDVISQILEQSGIDKIFDLEFYLIQTGMGPVIVTFIVGLITRIYDILALAGVPILLFLASIQSVPKHLYEAAKIEGATGYEMFWLITLPNVSPHIVTVTVYALVDTFLTSPISTIISDELKQLHWGLSSAMAWIYVATILVMLGSLAVLAKALKIGGSHYEN
jgi:ABC-type sugar transport system permease subunit